MFVVATLFYVGNTHDVEAAREHIKATSIEGALNRPSKEFFRAGRRQDWCHLHKHSATDSAFTAQCFHSRNCVYVGDLAGPSIWLIVSNSACLE